MLGLNILYGAGWVVAIIYYLTAEKNLGNLIKIWRNDIKILAVTGRIDFCRRDNYVNSFKISVFASLTGRFLTYFFISSLNRELAK